MEEGFFSTLSYNVHNINSTSGNTQIWWWCWELVPGEHFHYLELFQNFFIEIWGKRSLILLLTVPSSRASSYHNLNVICIIFTLQTTGRGNMESWLRSQTLEPDNVGWNTSSATYNGCMTLGKFLPFLCLSYICRMRIIRILVSRGC